MILNSHSSELLYYLSKSCTKDIVVVSYSLDVARTGVISQLIGLIGLISLG